jgi:hypothetical protein
MALVPRQGCQAGAAELVNAAAGEVFTVEGHMAMTGMASCKAFRINLMNYRYLLPGCRESRSCSLARALVYPHPALIRPLVP